MVSKTDAAGDLNPFHKYTSSAIEIAKNKGFSCLRISRYALV
jgi:hypothetical protein